MREALTVQAYADRMGVSTMSVYTAIREGRLPYPVLRPALGPLMVSVPVQKAKEVRT